MFRQATPGGISAGFPTALHQPAALWRKRDRLLLPIHVFYEVRRYPNKKFCFCQVFIWKSGSFPVLYSCESAKQRQPLPKALKSQRQEYLKKCKICGFPLPPSFKFHVCDRCFRRQSRRNGRSTEKKLEKNRNRAGASLETDWEMGFKLEWFDPETE